MTVWLFWGVAACMSTAAAVLVLWPLWRHRGSSVSRRRENVAIYRERIAELRAEVASGRIPQVEGESLEAELGRRLLAEADDKTHATNTDGSGGHGRPWRSTIVLALAIPAVAFGLYLLGGDWRLIGDGPPELPYLAQRLEERVASKPEDSRAWVLLGRAREGLGEYPAAARAYARASALMDQPRPELLLREGQARVMANDGRVTDKAASLFRHVLEKDPDNGRALWFAGLAAADSGDPGRARTLWRRLAQKELPPSFRQVLEKRLATLPTGS